MTFRAVFISMLLVVGFSIAIAFTDHASSGLILLTGANHLPLCVVFILILFSLGINPLLKLFRPRWAFSQAELIVIWCIVAAGVGIPAFGLMHYMLPFLVAPFYFVGYDSNWAEAFYKHIPAELVPSKDPDSNIVMMFYEGRGNKPFPWDAMAAWVTPFLWWSVAIVAFFVMVFCITAIIRKQWVEYERLSFPLAQIPLEITAPPQEGRLFNSLFRSPLTWVGAALPIGFWGLTILHTYFPSVPYMAERNLTLMGLLEQMFTGWKGWININFLALGIAFLLSADVSLSLWFFLILSNVQRAMRAKLGYVSGTNDFEIRQQVGGFIAFAAIVLWTMRRHLWDVLRKAFLNAKDVDDSDNGFSYRFAVFGLIISSAVIIWWLWYFNCPVYVSLLFLVSGTIILIVLSRFIAQCGLVLVQTSLPAGPLSIVQDFMGDQAITHGGLAAVTFYQAPMFGDPREVLMPTLINNARVAEKSRGIKKLFFAMLAAVIIAFAVSFFVHVGTFYEYGQGIDTYATEIYPKVAMDRLASAIEHPKAAFQFDKLGTRGGIFHLAAGAGAFLLVYFLRARFYWWFLHPVGILTAHTMPLERLWLMFMLGWLCKSLAQKYARGPMMLKVKHFFLGMVVGDVMIRMVRTLVGLAFTP